LAEVERNLKPSLRTTDDSIEQQIALANAYVVSRWNRQSDAAPSIGTALTHLAFDFVAEIAQHNEMLTVELDFSAGLVGDGFLEDFNVTNSSHTRKVLATAPGTDLASQTHAPIGSDVMDHPNVATLSDSTSVPASIDTNGRQSFAAFPAILKRRGIGFSRAA
jgi:hypothetical protein